MTSLLIASQYCAYILVGKCRGIGLPTGKARTKRSLSEPGPASASAENILEVPHLSLTQPSLGPVNSEQPGKNKLCVISDGWVCHLTSTVGNMKYVYSQGCDKKVFAALLCTRDVCSPVRSLILLSVAAVGADCVGVQQPSLLYTLSLCGFCVTPLLRTPPLCRLASLEVRLCQWQRITPQNWGISPPHPARAWKA